MSLYTLEKIGNGANGSRCTIPSNFFSGDDLSNPHEKQKHIFKMRGRGRNVSVCIIRLYDRGSCLQVDL